MPKHLEAQVNREFEAFASDPQPICDAEAYLSETVAVETS